MSRPTPGSFRDRTMPSMAEVCRRHPHLAMVAFATKTAEHLQREHGVEPYPVTDDEWERNRANAKYHYEAHHPRRRDVERVS